MRRIIHTVLALTAVVVVAVPAVAVAAAEETARIVRDTVLRADPSHDSAEIASLTAGTLVTPHERSRLWVRVTTGTANRTGGWVRLNYLRGRPAATVTKPSRSNPFAGFSRSVSGFLGGFRTRNAPRVGQTATIGVRGLTTADLAAAPPDQRALEKVAQFISTRDAAKAFAAAGGVARRELEGG